MTPEHPFPKPVDECLAVTKYILHNAEEFGGDSERVVLAGDSAGGNAAAIITQTLLKDKSLKNQPKLQVLIYPWVQLVDQMGLPSCTFYAGKTFTSGAKLTFPKYVSWYLGIRNLTEEIELSLISNSHFALIDENERKEIISYLDPNKVPSKYKKDRSYYDLKANDIQKQFIYPSRLDDNHLLKREPKLAKLFKNLFSPEISPLLADSRALIGLPKAYIIILEWDTLKGIYYNLYLL
jgi:acetyl esterase/lipase